MTDRTIRRCWYRCSPSSRSLEDHLLVGEIDGDCGAAVGDENLDYGWSLRRGGGAIIEHCSRA
jgi:hypothetical protein